jgi:hypothetical protein
LKTDSTYIHSNTKWTNKRAHKKLTIAVREDYFLETGNWKTTRCETICGNCYITHRDEIEQEEDAIYNEYLEELREGIYGYYDDSDDSDNEN